MEILTFTALALFVGYISAALFIFQKVPRSISDTFYMYNEVVPGLGYVFTGFMWAEAFLIIGPMVHLASFEWWQFLGFLCPAGLTFCGAAPLFKDDKMVKIVHFAGAGSAAGFGLWWSYLLDFNAFFISLVSFLAASIIIAIKTGTRDSSSTFWMEIIAFGTITATLCINVF